MITIEHLEVLFDAEAASDEAVFAQLFARYTAQREQARRRVDAAEARLAAERSLMPRSDW